VDLKEFGYDAQVYRQRDKGKRHPGIANKTRFCCMSFSIEYSSTPNGKWPNGHKKKYRLLATAYRTTGSRRSKKSPRFPLLARHRHRTLRIAEYGILVYPVGGSSTKAQRCASDICPLRSVPSAMAGQIWICNVQMRTTKYNSIQ